MKSDDPLIGQKLKNRYKIIKKIGQGGMANIYQGYDSQTQRDVAIKVLGDHLPPDPALTTRFRREARAASALKHRHIINVYDYGEHQGGHYMVMEYIEGTNLQRRINYRRSRNQAFSPQEIVELVEQIASALTFAHKKSVIHRDVKPSNILLPKRASRGAILTDFGLVMLRDRVSQQTRGESFGTPEYIAPEQAIDSRAATARSDIYSLGVIIYELTTGHLPFDADSAISLALMHIGREPIHPRQYVPTMSLAVEAVILRAMSKEPQQRYASAKALAAALRQAYGDQVSAPARPKKKKAKPRPATRRKSKRQAKGRSRRRLVGGMALLFLLGAALFLLLRGGDGLPFTLPSSSEPTSSAASSSEPTSGVTPSPSKLPSPTALPPGDKAGAQALRPADGMTLHFVPGGSFLMGSSQDEADAQPHEKPQHTLELSPFWLDQTEVTNDQYRLCVEADACPSPVLGTFFDDPAYGDHPVVYVRWEHAEAYCAWLADETGWAVALPTEAQWEKAAAWDPQAQHHRLYPWGDQPPTTDLANLSASGLNKTTPVGSYPDGASFYGALDLAGNVWEWVADWYDQDYYARPDLPPDPSGPASGSQHVMRGGSFGFDATKARTAHRTAGGAQANGVGLGFRCAVNAAGLP
jgi:serine/threonine protein kinase